MTIAEVLKLEGFKKGFVEGFVESYQESHRETILNIARSLGELLEWRHKAIIRNGGSDE